MKKKYLVLVLIVPTLYLCKSEGETDILKTFHKCPNVNKAEKPKFELLCSTENLIAEKPDTDWTPNFLKLLAGAGHSGGSVANDGALIEFNNSILNMNHFSWDYSKQKKPYLNIRGNKSIIINGVILLGENGDFKFGSNDYFPPNFTTKIQSNNFDYNNNFIYSNNNTNMKLINMSIQTSNLVFTSWNGEIKKSNLFVSSGIYILGSKSFILNNELISQGSLLYKKGRLINKKLLFNLEKTNNSVYIDSSQQIFPDKYDDDTAIPATLYIKFSPDTVIDGNTFTLTKRNDYAYAIVLDHSPRVRIINNTFNGFKVPILMDQWSSIVDEKGNVINPDQFSGDVTMNRKGEIVKK